MVAMAAVGGGAGSRCFFEAWAEGFRFRLILLVLTVFSTDCVDDYVGATTALPTALDDVLL
jgi:hypothetical protein